jgi:hypothetical protein
LTLIASSFPRGLSNVKADSTRRLPRGEFNLWQHVVQSNKLARIPSFGDYGIVNPADEDFAGKTMKPSAKIRYTIEEDWLIIRGKSLRKDLNQYHDLSEKLINEKEFLGAGFSWGDDYVSECARKIKFSRQLTQWVAVDTNHHLTFVADQIAKTHVT